MWQVEPLETASAQGLRMRHRSPHGTEGFPGTLDFVTTYWLHADASWTVEFHAESDRATPVNLTQHSYFNLGAAVDVFEHDPARRHVVVIALPGAIRVGRCWAPLAASKPCVDKLQCCQPNN